jgi:rhodanese-related sulfurtransferase
MVSAPAGSRSIEQMLASARAKLRRLNPTEAYRAQLDGALVVDIRPAAQREVWGEIPGAEVIERNVLEWRLDPSSDDRLDDVDGYDRSVVVICQEGYTSSLAAASLQELGLHQATDVAGGYLAWYAAGLPTTGGLR